MFQGDIGTKSLDCPELVPIQVGPGQTVTVTNVGSTTITYINTDDSTGDGTIAPSASQSFTAPAYMYGGTYGAANRASVQITGGNY